jgi:ABC-type polysaccharide/polyol phosphate export permease
MMVILSVVFSTVFRFPQKNYAVYVLCGLLLFDFFTRSTVQMLEDVAASEALFRRIYLPRSVFAIATGLSYLTHWLIALVPLTALLLAVDQPITWALLTVLPAMALTAMFALGCGLMVATVGSFLPDVKLVYQVILTAWFYATPIIYPLEIVPERWQPAFRFNPLHHLLKLVRGPIYEGRAANFGEWMVAGAIAVGTLLLGWWVLCRWKDAIDYSA